MTRDRDEQKVRALALAECANYFRELNGKRNWCLGRGDHRCVFASEEDTPRCGYFERAVLPLDLEAGVLYYASRKAAAGGHELTPLQSELVRDAARNTNRRGRRVG